MKKVKIIALIAAIATGLFLYVFLNSLNKPEVIDRAKVVTAVVNIPADTEISAEMITLTELPTEAIISGAMTDTSSVAGKISDIGIFAGEQVLGPKLNSTGESDGKTLAYAIEPGMRAITISVSETSGVAFMLTPGDHVDIMGYFLIEEEKENEETEKTSYTSMVLENITVLAVDNVYSDPGKENSESPAYKTITLQVDTEQAMILSMAQSEGEIRSILRSPVDKDETRPPDITLEDVIGN